MQRSGPCSALAIVITLSTVVAFCPVSQGALSPCCASLDSATLERAFGHDLPTSSKIKEAHKPSPAIPQGFSAWKASLKRLARMTLNPPKGGEEDFYIYTFLVAFVVFFLIVWKL